MQALSIAFHAIVPLFLIILMGYVVKRVGFITPQDAKKFNKAAFYTFMPVMLFHNVYDSTIEGTIEGRYVLFTLAVIALIIVVSVVVTFLTEKRNDRRGVMIQAAFRSNFVLLGLPIAKELLPDSDFGVTAIMIAIVVPIFNAIAVITLELFQNRRSTPKVIFLAVIKNPLIIGAVAGLCCKALSLQLPQVILSFTEKAENAATPIMLFLLGASFEYRHIASHMKNLIVCVALRLLVSPAIALISAMLLGFRGIEFVTLLALFAAPTAVNSFNMTQQIGGDADLAGSAVIVSTACSFATLFFWVTLFKWLNMF